MTTDNNGCLQCGRKILPSISNRCLYCGADLPEEHHLTRAQKGALLSEKMEGFRQNEANREEIIRDMRRDFGIPEPKRSRKQRKADNDAAVVAAVASINSINNGNGSGST